MRRFVAEAALTIAFVNRSHDLEHRKKPVTPKLKGIAGAMAKLQHGLDDRADKLLARIESADQRSDAAFKKAHGTLDAAEAAVADVEEFVAGLEGSNGGPLSGSDSASGEPQTSWSKDKP